MANAPKDIGASVRARLLAIARETGQVFDVVLTRYVLERLLYRLGQSGNADRFVLKGAMLLTTWLPHTNRGTRDLDLLGFGDSSEERILGLFRQVMAVAVADGVTFDLDALRIEQIREAADYGGVRLKTLAFLAGAQISVVVDIGFGDSVEPGLDEIDYPVLLDMPSPRLRAYAPETVIAEKLQAMVALGRANTRMKDFYDIWILSYLKAFDDDRLSRAIAGTFARRKTDVPTAYPDAFTNDFADDPSKQRQWAAFARDVGDAPVVLNDVVARISAFAWPHIQAATRRS